MMKPRDFLSAIGSTVTVADAAVMLQVSPDMATKILSRWTIQGWLERVGHGLYAPKPISSLDNPTVGEFAIAANIIGDKGYVCGWSAMSHHGLTEQIFNDISLNSFKWTRYKEVRLKNFTCCIFKIREKEAIGLEALWYHDKKVYVSDIHKTVLDVLAHPACGGGFMHIADCFRNYLTSEDCNIEQVLSYAKTSNAKGIFYKRFGYLLKLNNADKSHIDYCHSHITSGYYSLDPQIKSGKFCSRWQLIIPEYIKL